MRKFGILGLSGLALLALLLAACESEYTSRGSRTTTHQGLDGGSVHTRITEANGTAVHTIEVDGTPKYAVETDVTLTVEEGMFKIELIGRNDTVSLVLEARDGETVSGHGFMATDNFGDVSYIVTAVNAKNVEYTIEYVY
jgi:hypothetical protein